MKLYTEKQVRQAIVSSIVSYGRWLEQEKQITPGKLVVKHEEVMEQQLSNLTPIELPSDEEIEAKAKDSWITYEYEEGNLYHTTYNGGFANGAKWVIEQIKQ
jgi:hypothetical protein